MKLWYIKYRIDATPAQTPYGYAIMNCSVLAKDEQGARKEFARCKPGFVVVKISTDKPFIKPENN